MDKREILEIIAKVSGCDGSDDYARGWDDACRAMEAGLEKETSCWCGICNLSVNGCPEKGNWQDCRKNKANETREKTYGTE